MKVQPVQHDCNTCQHSIDNPALSAVLQAIGETCIDQYSGIVARMCQNAGCDCG